MIKKKMKKAKKPLKLVKKRRLKPAATSKQKKSPTPIKV